MDFSALLSFLSSIHPLSEKFIKSLEKELAPIWLPRNHVLIQAPQVAEFVYFINSGFAMAYSYQNKKKIVEGFWRKGQVMTAAGSFYEQTPSVETIQLMQDSELFCLSHASLHRLFRKHTESHYLYHKILNRHFAQCRARIRDIQRLSAMERLEILGKLYPDIEQIVSQESIASYLGITPQSLSRLKRSKETD